MNVVINQTGVGPGHYRPGPVGLSGAGVGSRRLRSLDTGLAERGREGVLPVAIVVRLLDGVVEELAHLRVVVGEVADPVALLAERLTDDLEVFRVGRFV